MLVPKTYDLLVQAIEDGIASGWRRAEKHADTTAFQIAYDKVMGPSGHFVPMEDTYREAIFDAVLNEILHRFHLQEGDEEAA